MCYEKADISLATNNGGEPDPENWFTFGLRTMRPAAELSLTPPIATSRSLFRYTSGNH